MGAGVEVPVGIKNAAFKRGLDEMRRQAADFKRDMSRQSAGMEIVRNVASGLALGTIISSFNSLLEKFGALQDASDKWGESAVVLQKIEGAGRLCSVTMEDVARVLAKATLAATKAANATDQTSNGFRKLGIDAQEFADASMDEKLLMLSEAMQRADESGQGTTAMLGLLGMKAQAILPLLAQGPEQLKKELEAVNAIGDSTVAMLDNVGDMAMRAWHGLAGFTAGTAGNMLKVAGSVASPKFWFDALTEGMDAARAKRQKWYAEVDGDLWGSKKRKNVALDDEEIGETAKAVESLAQLKADIAAKEADIRRSAMSDEAKLRDMERERFEYRQKAIGESAEALKARKGELETNEKILKLRQEMREKADAGNARLAELDRKAKREQMDPREQLKDIYAERNEWAKRARGNSPDAVKAREKVEALEKEAGDLSEKLQDRYEQKAKRKVERNAAAKDALAEARAAEQSQDEKNKLDAADSPAAKAGLLEAKRRQLELEAKKLEQRAAARAKDAPDDTRDETVANLRAEASRKRTEAKGLSGDILALQKEEAEKAHEKKSGKSPHIFASAFAATGLGGHAAALGPADRQLAELKETNGILRRIESALSKDKAPSTSKRAPAFASEFHER